MREDCGFGKAKEMPRVGIGSVPDLVDNGNAFKTMDALRKQEKELRGKIDTMEVSLILAVCMCSWSPVQLPVAVSREMCV